MINDLTKRLLKILGTIIGFILLLIFLRFGLAIYLYSVIGKWATTQLGLDYYESEFMAVAVSTLLMCFVPGLSWLFVSRKTRLLNAGLVIGGYFAMCILVYTVGRNTYFNQSTGESLRYYADTPDGRIFSFLPGYDPKWGIERKPFTREAAQEAIRQIELEKERKRKAELNLQKQEEEKRKREYALSLKQQEAEIKRQEREQLLQEAAAQRTYALEQQKLLTEERRLQREHELQLAQQQRDSIAQQQQIENEHREQKENAAAEQERQQQAMIAERERQAQIERENQQRETHARQEQEQRQKEEDAKRKRAEMGSLIEKGVRAAEKISGKKLRFPF